MFFGDKCSVLGSLNTMFILLFQTAIIPFMIFSIIQSIGSLTSERAKSVARKGGLVLLCIWTISIVYAWGLQFSFPNIVKGKFFTPESSLSGNSTEFYKMFIPSNPFNSLANGYIPAIVIFCILVGMALINQSKKEKVVDAAGIFALVMNRVNDYIMKLLPLGVLVMSSYTFGTLSYMQFKGVLLYIIGSIFYLLFISVIIYPCVLASISRINRSRFFHFAMPAALIAFTTGSVFLSLPVIYDQMYKLNDEEKGFKSINSDNYLEMGRNAISIIVPLAWVVPASYKFLVIFFVIFEQWYYNSQVNFIEQLFYFIGGIPCFFGSNSVIVPFLLQITSLPDKTYDIFMMVSSFIVYFNNANGAAFIIVVTIICYLSLCNKLRIRYFKMLFLLALSTLFYASFILALNIFMTQLLSGDDELKNELMHMQLNDYNRNFGKKIDVVYLNLNQYQGDDFLDTKETILERIARTGTMKVGYDPQAIPFSFFNSYGHLVGYDIEFIYEIAHNLACKKIEFYPITNIGDYENALKEGKFIDICVGGFIYTGEVMNNVFNSQPYMKCTVSIVIPEKLRSKYPNIESVFYSKELTLGYRRSRSQKSIKYFIDRPYVSLDSFDEFYVDHKTDALLLPGEMASAIGIMHPGYWVYYYYGEDYRAYFAYALPYNEKASTFREDINDWINTRQWTGEDKKRFDYWVLGKVKMDFYTPWSVLGWIKEYR
ncbi:MAG: hypothetical protein A2X47_09450 [Lentisphaerae bacterium GWF2_38_69]|nr:MAG: hypothetical protein A2X47_09450 [Lentisphaerae bacterium GWF2_38_69]